MQTLECSQCGAPITYDSNFATSAHCPYCQSQVTLPNNHQIEQIVMPNIDITIGPQVTRTASKALIFVLLIPVIIVIIVFAGVFGDISQVRRALTPLTSLRDKPIGSRPGEMGNGFVTETLKFGSEGIRPGMMTDARSIAVDGRGNIYVG